MLAFTGVRLYSPNSFSLLQMTPLILPTVSLAVEKKPFRIITLPLVLLAKNDCANDRTGSSRVNRPFYWILLQETNFFSLNLPLTGFLK